MFNESYYVIAVKRVKDFDGHPLPEIDRHYEYFAMIFHTIVFQMVIFISQPFLKLILFTVQKMLQTLS